MVEFSHFLQGISSKRLSGRWFTLECHSVSKPVSKWLFALWPLLEFLIGGQAAYSTFKLPPDLLEWNFHIQQFILKYSGNIFSLCWMNVPCLIKLPSWLLTRHFETQEAINVIYGVNTMRDFWKILSIIPCKSRSSGVKINIISSYPCFHALKLHLSANIRISLSLSAWKSDLLLEKPHFGWWKNMTWKILQW